MKEFGIDISKWQGDFDFDAALKEGVKFAVVKGGGGDSGLYVDSKFLRNYAEAKKRNLPVGTYWFSKALTVDEAEKEAEYFYKNVLQDRKFELPVYMDVEHKAMLALGKDKLTAIVKAWCEYLEKRGYFVGIYSSKAYFDSYVNDAELQGYAHWVAQWSKTCTYKNTDCLGMWQFGGETNPLRTNKVAGVVCDQDYMLVDYPTMIKRAGKNGFVKKSIEELAKEVIAGKYGNGVERKEALGDDYEAVQAKVNEILNAPKKELKVGSVVRVNVGARTYTNQRLAAFIYYRNHDVKEIKGDRVVISYNGTVIAAVRASDLTVM